MAIDGRWEIATPGILRLDVAGGGVLEARIHIDDGLLFWAEASASTGPVQPTQRREALRLYDTRRIFQASPVGRRQLRRADGLTRRHQDPPGDSLSSR